MWWQVCKFRLARRLLRTSCQVVHPTPLFPCSAVRGLLGNPHLQMAPYIHHLLPGWLPLRRVAVPAPANMLWGALQLLAFSYKACRRVAPCAAILTCLVARGVGTTATGWSIREEASFGCISPLLHSWHELEQRGRYPSVCQAAPEPFHLQAAALLGLVAQRSQEHNDELAAALARVQKSLASALLDDASETQFGE